LLSTAVLEDLLQSVMTRRLLVSIRSEMSFLFTTFAVTPTYNAHQSSAIIRSTAMKRAPKTRHKQLTVS